MKTNFLSLTIIALITALSCQAGDKGQVSLSAGLGFGWYDFDDIESDSYEGSVQFGYYVTRNFEWKAGLAISEPDIGGIEEDAFEASFGFRYYNLTPPGFDAYAGASISYLEVDTLNGSEDDFGALFEVGFLQPISDRISIDYSAKYRYYDSFELDAYSASVSVVFGF